MESGFSACLSASRPDCLRTSACLSPNLGLSVCLSACLSASRPVCLPLGRSVCLSACLSPNLGLTISLLLCLSLVLQPVSASVSASVSAVCYSRNTEKLQLATSEYTRISAKIGREMDVVLVSQKAEYSKLVVRVMQFQQVTWVTCCSCLPGGDIHDPLFLPSLRNTIVCSYQTLVLYCLTYSNTHLLCALCGML